MTTNVIWNGNFSNFQAIYSKGKRHSPWNLMTPEQRELYRTKQRHIQLNLNDEAKKAQRERMRIVATGGRSNPKAIGSQLVHESVPILSKEFLERIKRPDRQKRLEKYQGVTGAFLFLRYYSRFRRRHLEEYGAPITFRGLQKTLPVEARKKIQLLQLTYTDAIRIRRELRRASLSYNTEDGQIRWLLDHNFPHLTLSVFWAAIPEDVKRRMTEWRYMTASPCVAAQVYKMAQCIDQSYNTIDGLTRWLKDMNLVEVGTFKQLIKSLPKKTRKLMTEWQIHLPDGKSPESIPQLDEFLGTRSYVAKALRSEYKLERRDCVCRIGNCFWRARLPRTEIDSTLRIAFDKGSSLVAELRKLYDLKRTSTVINIEGINDLYVFAEQRLGLVPLVTFVILRLRGIDFRNIRNLVNFGSERLERKKIFSMHAPPRWNGDGRTLEAKLGSVDSEHEVMESREILSIILKENRLPVEQVRLLKRVAEGHDIEDDDYEVLASAIRKHPELMALLEA